MSLVESMDPLRSSTGCFQTPVAFENRLCSNSRAIPAGLSRRHLTSQGSRIAALNFEAPQAIPQLPLAVGVCPFVFTPYLAVEAAEQLLIA